MNGQTLDTWWGGLGVWATGLLVPETLLQLAVVALTFPVARVLASRLRRSLSAAASTPDVRSIDAVVSAVGRQSLTLFWFLQVWGALLVAETAGWPDRVLTLVSSLLLAWLVIGIASGTVRSAGIARAVAVVAWTVAALNVLDWLDPTLATLDRVAMQVGALRISALGVLKAVAALAGLLWAATLLASFIEVRLRRVEELTPSAQVLLGKLSRTILISLALVLALASVGIDLTAFAVFSGAVGVGVGFGLQKIVSNLVAGLILLLDKSIKPGDVIAVADYYGRVDALGARYVSVMTRDGIEHLIPNEELVTSRVENWSHSQKLLRIKVPVGVHYKSDVHKARALCLEAAAETERILDDPATVCHLRGFGDSSVDLEIRFWINDPMNGRANVTSDMLLRVWDKFHQHGIEIPYPQRDLHIRTPGPGLDLTGSEPRG